ncbi:hypothetical protein DFJ58DRAFT_730795 [Suillus subalutaceus]|uniref:uncharacterized protein n=1 Tax=Suillus subalutaceus TaxID=48586 RepID=UPI001B85EE88|nr:uncharacterized protein DFJ58DRAFT_730795 [Suillus subalutaceus]KAG1845733.1 hypothetical protein DFJ58DRAFT_730795 [Suillus subalutaceus]
MEDTYEQDHDIPSAHLATFCICFHGIYEPPAVTGQRPSQRKPRPVPRDFQDILPPNEDINPSDSSGNDLSSVVETQNPPRSKIQRVLLTLHDSLQTSFNIIGLCRKYPRRPSFEPDKYIPSSLLAISSPTTANAQRPEPSLKPPYPFPNMTVYRLMSWMNSGSHHKSEAEISRLIKDVIQAEEFNPRDLDGFFVRESLHTLDNSGGEGTANFPDDWLETGITLDIPTKSKDEPSRLFNVPGFHYRPLVGVIRSTFADIQANAFHLLPFKRLWKNPLDGHQEHLFNELYTSDSWLEAQDDLQRQPREPNCSLERVIAGLMFFSDATHLATFGTAKAWPLYMYFGNLTKYARSAPKSVYPHGIVLQCPDGIWRRVFPRIFTYSTDYPEKVLIATIKDTGSRPCPRCLTPKASFDFLGLFKDMQGHVANLRTYCLDSVTSARTFIYGRENTVNGSKVQAALGGGLWVPTKNTFAENLGPLGFDTFRMLVVDFMHECELGTWKALFTLLIRLLYALPGGDCLVATLDSRFRQLPSYGNGVIRKFANNTSEMKRLAARDFEDILQCAILVFKGLFPEDHDNVVQSLLYRFAQWHALAKLRMHSKTTLSALDTTFKYLSGKLRRFCDFTCAAFATLELPREKAAHEHKAAHERSASDNPGVGSGGRKAKKFNLNTYKFHAMGDYPRSIQLFGTIDSYISQIGELAHRALKVFYPLTNKLDTSAQLAKHEHCCRVLRRVQEDFVPKLKDHVLYRLLKLDVSYCDHAFTHEERNSVIISESRLYSVQTMQVHYTTYDLRREYDTVNPRTHCNVMVLSGETSPQHPYWHAQGLGIYHMDAWLNVEGPIKRHQIEVLYVRWLAPLSDHRSGMRCARLPKVAFIEESDRDAFGFLDPGQVIRGAHLIPAFASGHGTTSLRHGKSFARQCGSLDDWEAYYVGIFIDRDMHMRYTHHGVGHPAALREITKDSRTAQHRRKTRMTTTATGLKPTRATGYGDSDGEGRGEGNDSSEEDQDADEDQGEDENEDADQCDEDEDEDEGVDEADDWEMEDGRDQEEDYGSF